MTLPFVSIVICSRNRLKALQRYALPSIATIDYPSFEVVVVDDASTDGTREFLQNYQFQQATLQVVRNKQAKGLCNARNVGVANSRGEIIAFIDDDCSISTTWIHEIVKAYTRESIAVVGGISYKGDSQEIYINDKHVWGCNMSFRASIFKRFRFDTGLKYSHYADETDLIGRIISHGYERVVAQKAVAKHYVEDAAYRKQVPLSAYLNYHYLKCKERKSSRILQLCDPQFLETCGPCRVWSEFQRQDKTFSADLGRDLLESGLLLVCFFPGNSNIRDHQACPGRTSFQSGHEKWLVDLNLHEIQACRTARAPSTTLGARHKKSPAGRQG